MYLDFVGSAQMSRTYNIDIDTYDGLVIRLRPGVDVTVGVTATIDGVGHNIAANVDGSDYEIEIGGSIPRGHLERVQLTFNAKTDEPQSVLFRWILLTRPGNRWNPPERPFHGMIADIDGEYSPGLGLVFDAEDLNKLRTCYLSAEFAPIWQHEQAAAASEFPIDPESTIRQYGLYASTRYGRTWDEEVDLTHDGFQLALCGIIERNPDYLRQAARYAIAFARMEDWSEGFVDRMETLAWYHSGFAPTVSTLKAALLLDWTWNWMTPKGREFVREAIRTKGLPYIENARNAMANQGIRFNKARIVGHMAVSDDWSDPTLQATIQDSIAIINRKMEEAIRPDGTFSEGMGYGKGTTASTLLSYIAASRCLEEPVADLCSPRILPALRFMLEAEENISPIFAAFATGSLGIADFKTYCAPTSLLQGYLSYTPDRGNRHSVEFVYCGLPNIWAPLHQKEPEQTALPQFSRYSDGGWVFMGSDNPDSPRVSFESGLWDGVGHAWLHKNAVTMTGWGETLLLPRFHLAYSDARSNYTMSTKLHNTFSPAGRDQDAVGTAGCGSRLLIAKDFGAISVAEADCATAWKTGVSQAIRRVLFVRPFVMIIEDIVSLTDEETGVQSWNSLAPWIEDSKGTYHSDFGEVSVRVRCLSSAAEGSAGEESVHRHQETGEIVPAYRAAFTTPASKKHHLITVIEAIPPNAQGKLAAFTISGRDDPVIECLEGSRTIRIAIGRRGGSTLWDCQTDGESAFAVRENGAIVIAGAFNASRVSTEAGEVVGRGFLVSEK
jgi:hypothetical protein